MSSPLANPAFRTLFAAQICSLVAVGLLTVALSLTAYDLGGDAAGGRILGFLLALKMVAYVGLAPFAETLLANRPRRPVMVALDLSRLALLLPMALVTQTWQIAALAFAFFAVSSAFTPLFQSVIPDLLPEEETYSRALAYSRIAYTLESILSPVIAGVVLRFVASDELFYCAALAFLGSVAALLATRFPVADILARKGPFLRRAMRGLSIYRHTPRLRGLFLLNFALSLSMAWVLVNTVVFAGQRLGDAEHYYPILMAFYGVGAAAGALLVPRLVKRMQERRVMFAGAVGFAAIGVLIVLPLHLVALAVMWTGFGLASSLVLTPGGLVLARSANREDRPAVFAAQFSLSHAGWLVAYPLAGWLASWVSLETALVMLAALGSITAVFAMRVWPADDPLERVHAHPELPDDHPHLNDEPSEGSSHKHRHAYRIDDLHPHWPGSPA
ncbi:MFS transporter [Oricola sp.]|uniref:MFS transporter n=1 Tax=Oricola sp. TaxID=1979950 RepID=UPI0025D9AACF|nr:MFS transporter [Oricola sp.]MCI5077237.1 MFS transporter [Oricola sp.]